MQSEPQRVVVVGAGFAGLHVVRSLRRERVRITIVDRRNHHLFQPLLYQVASAALDPSDIAYPIRAVFRKQRNVERVLLAEVEQVDLESRSIRFDDGGVLEFDFVVIATGVTHSYFGNEEWGDHAPGLKTVEDALEIRRRVLSAFERAERYPAEAEELLTFVVVGAGPTGVELAGSLIEIAMHALARDFRAIDPRKARVILLEGGPRVLPAYPEDLSEKARAQLEDLGVDVRTDAQAVHIDARIVRLADDTELRTRTVLWAAGVQASPLARSIGCELDKAGRVLVEPDLSIPEHREAFVVGDLASVSQSDGTPVPGVAPAAIQGGKHVARQIRRELRGLDREPFRYHDKGSLATIGRARAVADFGKLRFGGFLAWFAWMVIHVLFLIGFRNRLFVLLSWTWSYVTFRRGARLITGRGRRSAPADPGD